MGATEERWSEAQAAEREFWTEVDLAAFHTIMDALLDMAVWASKNAHLPDGEWLEVGVGPLGVGVLHFLGSEITTLDPIARRERWPIPEPCVRLVESLRGGSRELVGKAEEIDFTERFTVVACHNALDHMHDPERALSNARRALTPNGRLVLAVDVVSLAGALKYRAYTRRRHADKILVRAHPFHFTAGQVVRLVKSCGFEILALDGPGAAGRVAGRAHQLRLVAQAA